MPDQRRIRRGRVHQQCPAQVCAIATAFGSQVEAHQRVRPAGPQRGPDHQPGLANVHKLGRLLVVKQFQPRPGWITVGLGQCLEDYVRRRWLAPRSTPSFYHRHEPTIRADVRSAIGFVRGRLVPSRHHAHDERHRRRLAAVREHSGALTGAYTTDYLDRLREEWPA